MLNTVKLTAHKTKPKGRKHIWVFLVTGKPTYTDKTVT